MDDWADKRAADLLTCSVRISKVLLVGDIERDAILNCGDGSHHIFCPAYYRPAIAAALREARAEALDAAKMSDDYHSCQSSIEFMRKYADLPLGKAIRALKEKQDDERRNNS